MDVTLHYWKIRGLGAPSRMMLAYVGANVTEKQYAWSQAGDWFGLKPKLAERESQHHLEKMANLPFLEDGKTTVAQSTAVYLYIARKGGLEPKTLEGKTANDVMLADCYDLRDALVQMVYWYKMICRNIEEFEQQKKEYFAKKANAFLDKWESYLKGTGNDYFAGKEIAPCDFHVWEQLDQHCIMADDFKEKNPLEGRPNLKAFYDRFRALEKLKGYFASDNYKLPINVPEFSFWSGKNSVIPEGAPGLKK